MPNDIVLGNFKYFLILVFVCIVANSQIQISWIEISKDLSAFKTFLPTQALGALKQGPQFLQSLLASQQRRDVQANCREVKQKAKN